MALKTEAERAFPSRRTKGYRDGDCFDAWPPLQEHPRKTKRLNGKATREHSRNLPWPDEPRSEVSPNPEEGLLLQIGVTCRVTRSGVTRTPPWWRQWLRRPCGCTAWGRSSSDLVRSGSGDPVASSTIGQTESLGGFVVGVSPRRLRGVRWARQAMRCVDARELIDRWSGGRRRLAPSAWWRFHAGARTGSTTREPC